MDEAIEMARLAFRENVADNLSKEEMDELASCAAKTSGSPSEEWGNDLGYKPDSKRYYEVHLYKPSDECPYIEKSYVKILVPRSREETSCKFIWKPEVEPYDGPWFS